MSQKTLPKGDPAFCFISPSRYLSSLEGIGTRHLVLAHIVAEADTNPAAAEYVRFYKERSEAGDYIICDNSAFELGASFDPNELIKLAKKIGADALVLPDYPGLDVSVTIDAAIEWAPRFKEAGLHTFFVPQSEPGDLSGWINGYEWATKQDNIDIIGWSILGVPNALPNVSRTFARVVMANLLQDRDIDTSIKYNHFLGLNAGPGLELPSLLKMGVLDSCDSSGPIWSAINGHTYTTTTDSLMAVNKHQLPHVDFDYPLPINPLNYDSATDDPVFRRIQTNIKLTNVLFGKE